MKNSIKLVVICSIISLILGCYRDKGNYIYKDRIEIKIEGIEPNYSVVSHIDTLHITPKITPEGREYRTFWMVYPRATSGYKPTLDTINKSQEFHDVIELLPGTYEFIYGVEDVKTGVVEYKESTLSSATSLSTGWYFLTQKGDICDLDYFSPERTIRNVIATYNPDHGSIPGNASCIAYSADYNVLNPLMGKYIGTRCLFTLTDKEIVVTQFENGAQVYRFNDIFYETPAIARPQKFYGDMQISFIVNNGRIHDLSENSSTIGKYGTARVGDYDISSEMVRYFVGNPLLYDIKSSSFCSIANFGSEMTYYKDTPVPISGEILSPNKMNMDLLFMGPTRGKEAFSLMRNKTTGDYYTVITNVSNKTPNPIITSQKLDPEQPLCRAEKIATLDGEDVKNKDYFFFSVGNTIYSSKVLSPLDATPRVTVNDKITWMRHMKFRSRLKPTLSFTYLTVATVKDGRYKVLFYKFDEGVLTLDETMIFEGEGEVYDAIYTYNSEYIFKA